MSFHLNEKIKSTLIKIIWVVIYNIYIIKGINDFKVIEPKIKCAFIPITLDNHHRVQEFREERRVEQYKEKLLNNEIGYFAEHNGKIIGSIWATINKTQVPRVVQTFKTIKKNEALVHDIVVSNDFRGMRIGPFMESSIFTKIFNIYEVSALITDANIRNHASLRMHSMVGARIDHKMFYIALVGKPILKLRLKKY